jgi:hypothetical protein
MVNTENNNPSTSAQHLTCHYSSKYEKWYWSIIQKVEKRRTNGSSYLKGSVEEHHVIPECLFPKNWEHIDRHWKVTLTPREHYILHLLLGKMEMTPFIARSITRFLNNTKHPHLVKAYTKLPNLGKSIVSKHGYNIPPYRNTATSTSRQAKNLWMIADQIYNVWLHHRCGGVKLSTLVGVRRSTSVSRMVRKFEQGWVPSKDLDWISFKNGW